jgi:pimeloyl-ACP methyl ester carboxylesterase
MARHNLSPEQAAEASVPFIYDSGTPSDRIAEDIAIRRPWFPRPEAYLAQLQGILACEAYSHLSGISVPTLVIHGESDRLVPPGNGKLIADRIPGARLVMIPHASHLFLTDQTEAANRAIVEFLHEQTEIPARDSTQKRGVSSFSNNSSEREKASC